MVKHQQQKLKGSKITGWCKGWLDAGKMVLPHNNYPAESLCFRFHIQKLLFFLFVLVLP